MKKLLATFLVIAMLLPTSVQAADGGEAVTYEQAAPSADTTVRITHEGDGKFNVLKNGDFEVVNSQGVPQGWSLSGGTVGETYMTVKAEDAPSGENYARFYGETENTYLYTALKDVLPGNTYTFSAKVRQMSDKIGSVLVYFYADKKTETSHETIKNFNKAITLDGKEWTTVSFEAKLPEETARIRILLRLVGGGEVHWDDIKLVGEVEEKDALAHAFRAQLSAEAELDEATNTMEMRGLYDYDKPYPGQGNLVKNGDFEANDGEKVEEWGLRSNFSNYFTLVEGGSHDGSDCVKFTLNGETDGAKHPFLSQSVPMVGGAEYQVSFWYKIIKGTQVSPRVKLEYYPHEKDLPGITTVGEKYAKDEKEDYSGNWKRASMKVYPGANVAEAKTLVRIMQKNPKEEVEVCFDDVEIYMTTPPPAFELDGGWVFYYSDWDNGTLSTSVNTAYYPELASAKVDYAIMDGTETIWESKGHISENGVTTVDFPLTLLAEKDKAYRAKASLYNADGSVHSIATQNVYMYDRPEYMGKDGIFMKEGKTPICPVFAYHASHKEETFQKLAAAGVNTIQFVSKSTPEAVKADLDLCEKYGIMALVTLYPGMKCAGHDDNIENTIMVVNAAKDHPATLGYIVMDEVFLHRPDAPAELEDSFRLIHSLDKKHPVAVMEASANFYEKAGKYVDLLLTDPYSKAYVKRASQGSEKARQALKYEKPVYSLLEAYYSTGGSSPGYPMPNDGRNNNWQALIAGAKAVGYYSISDSDIDQETGKYAVPIWNARDGGALWDSLTIFGNVEKEIAFDHFVLNKTPEFNEYRGDDYWYSSWSDGQDIYMIVLGMKKEGTQEVSIPLTSFAGDIRIADYTATMIAGRDPLETVTGSGSLDITLSDVEALLYKITPVEATDFSTLGATGFEDLGAYPWARQQIGRMDSLDIITGRNDFSYAPSEKITRAEFAGFLIRALGLTSDSTELFADVSTDNEFAKEIAVGKALGILKGTDGVNYNPDAEISRQDLMVICARGMRLVKELADGASVEGFTDAGLIADYAVADIAAMVQAGIIKGNADGTINPLGNTTRAEAAVIMDRCYTWKNE
ncbi:MAG: S-layer homology domain-containing protein [Clostridia bacterium]|nr:S-layer homology domain-containing protein [Clostridia bacterium]